MESHISDVLPSEEASRCAACEEHERKNSLNQRLLRERSRELNIAKAKIDFLIKRVYEREDQVRSAWVIIKKKSGYIDEFLSRSDALYEEIRVALDNKLPPYVPPPERKRRDYSTILGSSSQASPRKDEFPELIRRADATIAENERQIGLLREVAQALNSMATGKEGEANPAGQGVQSPDNVEK
ncbi:hypothetical protein BU24DRAFT_460371 [Aaosphaeria arxii CBS 175.79]|uniref:Uncharacterized protein n=1 Tax=Aaosphaeria arxii CBS 175.79 TaxID=1450172 RepID=A0A6A5XVG6_9PLEO|nr:uncharacterized protein BU24DRAFT_460371 [Aaosphaeria arxii CBS 175.79]KAF2017308.1 hypothetical protein BU24DRAFT_460371 [Aaosphaeria arxii CBS 175.79]